MGEDGCEGELSDDAQGTADHLGRLLIKMEFSLQLECSAASEGSATLLEPSFGPKKNQQRRYTNFEGNISFSNRSIQVV